MAEFEDSLGDTIFYAEALNDPIAQFQLANSWTELFGDDEDCVREEIDWLKKAVEGGYPPALEQMSSMLVHDAMTEQCSDKAVADFLHCRAMFAKYAAMNIDKEAAFLMSMPPILFVMYIRNLGE